VLPVHGDGAPLPLVRPAAGVGEAWPPDRPPRPTRVASRLVEAEPAVVPAKNVALVTVMITARAVTVPPGLLLAVSVPLT